MESEKLEVQEQDTMKQLCSPMGEQPTHHNFTGSTWIQETPREFLSGPRCRVLSTKRRLYQRPGGCRGRVFKTEMYCFHRRCRNIVRLKIVLIILQNWEWGGKKKKKNFGDCQDLMPFEQLGEKKNGRKRKYTVKTARAGSSSPPPPHVTHPASQPASLRLRETASHRRCFKFT